METGESLPIGDNELPSLQPMTVKLDVSKVPGKYLHKLKEENSALLRLPETLDFPTGIVLITGANGTGKTTLLRAISIALFPEQSPDVGDVTHLREVQAKSFSKALSVPDDRIPLVLESGTLINTRKTTHLSQRQGIDALLEEQLKAINKTFEISDGGDTEDIVMFIDEPELGMDPARQKKIEKEITDLLQFAPLVLVATNSPYLYDSNLPRIDLAQPEKGIFWPQEELNKRLLLGFTEGDFEESGS